MVTLATCCVTVKVTVLLVNVSKVALTWVDPGDRAVAFPVASIVATDVELLAQVTVAESALLLLSTGAAKNVKVCPTGMVAVEGVTVILETVVDELEDEPPPQDNRSVQATNKASETKIRREK